METFLGLSLFFAIAAFMLYGAFNFVVAAIPVIWPFLLIGAICTIFLFLADREE